MKNILLHFTLVLVLAGAFDAIWSLATMNILTSHASPSRAYHMNMSSSSNDASVNENVLAFSTIKDAITWFCKQYEPSGDNHTQCLKFTQLLTDAFDDPQGFLGITSTSPNGSNPTTRWLEGESLVTLYDQANNGKSLSQQQWAEKLDSFTSDSALVKYIDQNTDSTTDSLVNVSLGNSSTNGSGSTSDPTSVTKFATTDDAIKSFCNQEGMKDDTSKKITDLTHCLKFAKLLDDGFQSPDLLFGTTISNAPSADQLRSQWLAGESLQTLYDRLTNHKSQPSAQQWAANFHKLTPNGDTAFDDFIDNHLKQQNNALAVTMNLVAQSTKNLT